MCGEGAPGLGTQSPVERNKPGCSSTPGVLSGMPSGGGSVEPVPRKNFVAVRRLLRGAGRGCGESV